MTGWGRIHQYTRKREISAQKGSGVGKGVGLSGAPYKVLVLLGLVLPSLALYAQTSNLPIPSSNREIDNSAVLKLPVAHAHFGSWCMGFLTIAPHAIRYDAMRSHGKDEHSFSLKREQVLFLNYWVLAGQPMNAVEIRTATKTYHFWLVRSDSEFEGMRSSWRPLEAAPSNSLLLSLYYWRVTGSVPDYVAVNAALARAALQPGTAAPGTPSNSSGNGAVNDAYEKMSQHIFTNTQTYNSTVNQINSINHMSHW